VRRPPSEALPASEQVVDRTLLASNLEAQRRDEQLRACRGAIRNEVDSTDGDFARSPRARRTRRKSTSASAIHRPNSNRSGRPTSSRIACEAFHLRVSVGSALQSRWKFVLARTQTCGGLVRFHARPGAVG
jgi:hypothetical protein